MNKIGLTQFLLPAFCLFAFFLKAQKLDYSRHIALEVDKQTVHLYADAEHANDYYLAPYSGLFQFGKQPDGTPEFLFMRYTTDDNDATGGLLHCLVQWKVEAQLSDLLQKKLKEAVPGAVLKGITPLDTESKFYIVSGTASSEKVISSGQAPILPGSKAAVAMRLDEQETKLMYEQLVKGTTADLSFVFEYKIPFQTPARSKKIEINWEKYRTNYGAYSAVMGRSIQAKRDGFDFLLKEGIVSFVGGQPAAESAEFMYAQGFLMKYVKDVKPTDARANGAAIQRLSLADVQSDFLLPLQISVNASEWYDDVKNNPKCVAAVNLNDPFFKHRDVSIMLDIDAERIFRENTANYVTVAIKKDREKEAAFSDQITFMRDDFGKGATVKEFTYAQGTSLHPNEYQYKISWALKGGIIYPKTPAWTVSSEPVIAIPSPATAVDIVVDASDDIFKHPKLRAVTLEISYHYFGTTNKEYVRLVSKENGPGIATKTIFCDKDNPAINYRFIFTHKEKGRIEADSFPSDGDNYLVPILPDVFKDTPPISIVSNPTETVGKASDTTPGKPIQRTNKDYALFFAVSDYKSDATYPDLQNPIKDAKAIAGELAQRYGFRTELMENPTRVQIKTKIEEYSRKFETKEFDPEGQLLLFFSGHGEFADGNGFFLPSDVQPGDLDATAIAYPTWRSRIDNIACKHLLVVIDACYSGTFDASVAMRGAPMKRPGELSDGEKFYQEHLARTTRLFLASGGKEQTPDKSDFAKKLLEGLRVADAPFGLLTTGQLFELYVKQIRPVPLFGEFGKDEAGSSFIFMKMK